MTQQWYQSRGSTRVRSARSAESIPNKVSRWRVQLSVAMVIHVHLDMDRKASV